MINLENRHTGFITQFIEYALFLDDNVHKEANNFQIAKVQPQGVA